MIPWANKVNELTTRPEYIKIITDLADAYAKAGHKVLIVSDRTKFLEECYNIHKDSAVLVTGTTSQEVRDENHFLMEHSPQINKLYGAISIYKEGISLNFLSCLIVAAPINNNPLLKQLIGRITRKYPEKINPVVIDIALAGTTAKRQRQARAAYYMNQGYIIKYAELN
jgi:superfamily II DNA or RNA helicase